MRFPCKDYPAEGESDWCAFYSLKIANPQKHSPPSKRFEALIDTGASRCIFHASIGESLGFDIKRGKEEKTQGVSGDTTTTYVNTVALYIPGGILKVQAAFCYVLPLAGLLGRRGFLEHFRFTLDPSTTPPEFDLERIGRA